jgi:hypothetical protein
MPGWRSLTQPRPGFGRRDGHATRALKGNRQTYLWAVLYLLQEISIPMADTATHSVRTLAPFLLPAKPAHLLLIAMFAIVVIALHDFSVNSNLLISLTVLLVPFALISIDRLRLDVNLFTATIVRVLFGACVVQALLPGISNILFAPFIDDFLTFTEPFSRATGLSMEPSFAAETLFAIAMVHFFFARRFWSWTTVLITGALLLIRAGSFLQQTALFASVYFFLRFANFIGGTPAYRTRSNIALGLLSCVIALCGIVFGYSFFTYATLDLSFIRDSMDRFGSWRTLSNYAAYVSAPAISFFPHDTNDGWASAISGALRAEGLTGNEWVTQPFSAVGVALLDLGIVGAVLWVVLVFATAIRRMRRYALDTAQSTIVYTLLTNAIFFAPKWQLSGFLAIGLIATAMETSHAARSRHASAA